MTPGLFPVDSARYKKLIMPVFVFLICFQLFLLQVIFTIEDGKANKTVNQEKDANSSIALAASSPEQQASTNQPKASLTSDKAAVPTANPVPSSLNSRSLPISRKLLKLQIKQRCLQRIRFHRFPGKRSCALSLLPGKGLP